MSHPDPMYDPETEALHLIEENPDFEDYLQEIHAEDYHGLDDDMPDDFERFIGELEPEEISNYYQIYKNKE